MSGLIVLLVILLAAVAAMVWAAWPVIKDDFGFANISLDEDNDFNRVYFARDIFESIPGDDGNVILNIPEEVCNQAGLQPGDTVNVELVNGTIEIKIV